jgi:hypothetical protein
MNTPTLVPLDAVDWSHDFTQNAVIRELALSPRWAITDPDDKKPLSMAGLVHGVAYGASTKKPEDMMTLPELAANFTDAPNCAMWMKSLDCGYALIDIEKTCPEDVRDTLVHGLAWKYAETSLSGRGIHLIVPRPDELLDKYPNARKAAVRRKDGAFEVLLNHWVTFTRNVLDADPAPEDTPEALAILENLFSSCNPTITRTWKMPRTQDILASLGDYAAESIVADLRGVVRFAARNGSESSDRSRSDWSMACSAVRFVDRHYNANDIRLAILPTVDDFYPAAVGAVAAALLREVIETDDTIPWRDKYDEPRGDLPYLEYTVGNAATYVLDDTTDKKAS